MGQRLADNFPGTALATVTTATLTAVFSEVYKTCRALQRLKLLINQESDDSCHFMQVDGGALAVVHPAPHTPSTWKLRGGYGQTTST